MPYHKIIVTAEIETVEWVWTESDNIAQADEVAERYWREQLSDGTLEVDNSSFSLDTLWAHSVLTQAASPDTRFLKDVDGNISVVNAV